MLDGMRKASQGAIGKLVMTIVMGLIIVSFVIWGVGDMLRGFTSDTVAKVGATTITAQQYPERVADRALSPAAPAPPAADQRSRRARSASTPQVLDRMIDEAAVDERARALGLAISDETIAEVVALRSAPERRRRQVRPRPVRRRICATPA